MSPERKSPSPEKERSEGTARSFRRTRRDHAGELAEDYVELIHELLAATGEARKVDIAERLGVTHVTVTRTIERLKNEGLVASAPYRSVFLTPAGKRLALAAQRRHRIVLDFLRALGVPARDAELDAEGIEHHLSDSTLLAMRRMVESRRG